MRRTMPLRHAAGHLPSHHSVHGHPLPSSCMAAPSTMSSTPTPTPTSSTPTPSVPLEPAPEHPLQNAWTWWEHRRGGGGQEYGTNMKRIGEFSTVEGFWRFYNHLPPPSHLFGGEEMSGVKRSDHDREIEGISLFKRGVRPEWEDPKNMYGGEFSLKRAMTMAQLDQFWEDLVLGAIGETVDPTDVMCGVRVVDRSQKGKPTYRFEVWFECSKEQRPAIVDQIEQNIIVAVNSQIRLDYKPHATALAVGLGGGGGGGGGAPSSGAAPPQMLGGFARGGGSGGGQRGGGSGGGSRGDNHRRF